MQAIARSIQYAKSDEPTPPHEPASASSMSGESEMSLSALKLRSFRASFQSTVRVGLRAPLWVGMSDSVDGHDGPPPETSKTHFASSATNNDNENDNSSSSVFMQQHPPHNTTFEPHGNSTASQMEFTGQLLSSLSLPAD